MQLIDTHCHLYLEEFISDQNLMIEQAKEVGITALILPNVDVSTIPDMLHVNELYPDYTYTMMGLHPTSVKDDYAFQLSEIEKYLSDGKFCAIGEIGIDLYWDKTYIKEQKIVFEEQLKWSRDLTLPVSIHTRNAFPEVLETIHKVGADTLKGVFHSFSGDKDILEEVLALKNFKLGINGVVTFKNSGLARTLTKSNISDLVLETDAPYLSPVPYRGKRNEPSYMIKTAEKIAGIFDLSIEKVASETSRNACSMFGIVNKHITETYSS